MKREKRLNKQRRRRRLRVRNAVKHNSTRPRLSVFRSHKHMVAQIIDDDADDNDDVDDDVDDDASPADSENGDDDEDGCCGCS